MANAPFMTAATAVKSDGPKLLGAPLVLSA